MHDRIRSEKGFDVNNRKRTKGIINNEKRRAASRKRNAARGAEHGERWDWSAGERKDRKRSR